jgi:hypothetical protein
MKTLLALFAASILASTAHAENTDFRAWIDRTLTMSFIAIDNEQLEVRVLVNNEWNTGPARYRQWLPIYVSCTLYNGDLTQFQVALASVHMVGSSEEFVPTIVASAACPRALEIMERDPRSL